MAVTQNTYTGNGSTTNYSFTFPYLETTDIKVSVNGTNTTAYTLANATTIQFNTAPVNGAAIRIYRQTDDAALAATFYPGSAIRSADLNENFTQNLYVTQESSNNAATATTTANTALTNSNTAISAANSAVSTANSAVSTANTASANASAAASTANTANAAASAAASTANTASSNATTAVNTANAATATANSAATSAATAISTANGAVTTANAATATANSAATDAATALTTANGALTTASNASTTANTASSTASTALSNSNSAITTANAAAATANAASAAVANALSYTIVANVAAIPATPANNTAVEITNSTGIESFTPLSGVPVGFVGSSGLSVRIVYQTAGSTWTWIQYFPNDPETRYLKLSGGTLTGQLRADDSTSVAAPVYSFDGDTNTGIAHTGVDEIAIVTNGVARLTFDSSGNASFTNSVTIPAGSTVTGYAPLASPTFTGVTLTDTLGVDTEIRLSDADKSNYSGFKSAATVTSNTIWTLPSADGTSGQALSTNGSKVLSWSTYAPLASPTFTGTVTIPAGASISGYLTTSDAASTYQTQAGMSSYLTTATASGTYQPISAMSSYLTTYTTTTTGINKTLANRERCSVTASGLTITLPPSPSAGWEVSITVAGSFVNTIIARNSSNIMSLAENMTIDKGDVTVTLYYVDATRGWRII